MWLQALEQSSSAAVARILEGRIRSPAHVLTVEDDVAKNSLDIDDRNALADPLLVEHRRRMCPNLEVVGHHEMLRDARPEYAMDELLEVLVARELERLLLRFDQTHDAFEDHRLRQILDVVLKWIRKPSVEHPDPRFALQLLVVISHELVEQAVEVLVV